MDIFHLSYKYRLIILFFISFISTMAVYMPILRIAIKKNIVDNPDIRKLHSHPVPILGGVTVFFGIAVGLCFYKTMIIYDLLYSVLGIMIVMLYLGCIDDVQTIKPTTRIIVESIAAITLIYGMRTYICDFQGLWGIDIVSAPIGVSLSIITFLGILNSINMIDGIDGLSSSFCILIFGCFGIYSFFAGYHSFSVLAAVIIGALLPFFMHNVFGNTTKMFIGDGGILMISTAISAMVFEILSGTELIETRELRLDFSRIAFTLAVLSIPVADTLRVMFYRMAHHKSPFTADRNHLHHLMQNHGFSFISITLIELTMNILVIGIFFLSWQLGATIEVQLYVVVAVAALLNFGTAALLCHKDGPFSDILSKIASHTHIENKNIWLKIQKLIDNDFKIKRPERQ